MKIYKRYLVKAKDRKYIFLHFFHSFTIFINGIYIIRLQFTSLLSVQNLILKYT